MTSENPRHIFLTGHPGAGKTTVGGLVAEKTGLGFFDCSVEIMRWKRMNSPDIKRVYGEAGYGVLAERVLRNVIESTESKVITVMLGAVLNPNCRSLMRESGTVFYLFSPSGVIEQRRRERERMPRIRKWWLALRKLRSRLYSVWLRMRMGKKIENKDAEQKLLEELSKMGEHGADILFRQAARHVVDTADMTPEQVAAEIINRVNYESKNGVFSQTV